MVPTDSKIDVDLQGRAFGGDSQLEYLYTFSGFCYLRCKVCLSDPELYGDAVFKVNKSNLLKGTIPCGCSKSPVLSGEQKKILAERKAKSLGYNFIGWVSHYSGARTLCILRCKEHGDWTTTQLNNLLSKSTGCPGCKDSKSGERSRISDDLHIQEFLSTGCFQKDTIFKRSKRLNSQGNAIFWFIDCPVCKTVTEATVSSLKAGHTSCDCGIASQKEAYLSLVIDDGKYKAVKFGIATNSKVRNRTQNRKSIYKIELHKVWKFEKSLDCKASERECKKLLSCGILTKQEMKDGWTETTYPYNIEIIESIFQKYGGKLIYGCPF